MDVCGKKCIVAGNVKQTFTFDFTYRRSGNCVPELNFVFLMHYNEPVPLFRSSLVIDILQFVTVGEGSFSYGVDFARNSDSS